MKKKNISKQVLFRMYIKEEKNPYEIGKELGCNHKTIRSYLRQHNIPLRTPSEYNFLSHKNYEAPTKTKLLSKKSVAAHIAYICEGWHTEKSTEVNFSNQDPALIDLVKWCIEDVYKAKTRIVIAAENKDQCNDFFAIYPDAKFARDKSRKNPIIRLRSGGKMLVRDLVQNAYQILSSFE